MKRILFLLSLSIVFPSFAHGQGCYSSQFQAPAYQSAPQQQTYSAPATSCYSSQPQSFSGPGAVSYGGTPVGAPVVTYGTPYVVSSTPVTSYASAAPARRANYDAVYWPPPAEPAYLAPIPTAPVEPQAWRRIIRPYRTRTVMAGAVYTAPVYAAPVGPIRGAIRGFFAGGMPRRGVSVTESRYAMALAHRVLDRPSADPDEDLAVMARQMIRQHEANDELREALVAMQDPTADLIHANRDAILEIYREALRRIKHCLRIGRTDMIPAIVDAAEGFHPMYEEGWDWPEGSDYR